MNGTRMLALGLVGTLLLSSACSAQGAGDPETEIRLSDEGITVDGVQASRDPEAAVYVGAEPIYYHDGTDNTYGEGTEAEKHSAQEAAAHTVVTITQPGTYRLSGTLSRGQIAIDLGEGAKDDPAAVVTLILDHVNVTCTVAPALIFYNVYECDRAFVSYDRGENPDYQASAVVDTSEAGANVVLAADSENTFTGSHVARIYKEGTTKKLHKYDGAFYSRMSMNISEESGGGGCLRIVADNEGLDSELHLTLNSGEIQIEAQDDGINTNEDFVSVTTINGGTLTVNAGLGSEGDGIDSNGYLVINGGTIRTMSNDRSPDGGIDADSPILIHGGRLSAFGTRNDAADSDSRQPYMELSFAATLPAGSQVKLTDPSGETVWSAVLEKACQSVTLSVPELELDTAYQLYVDDVLQCWNGNAFGLGGPGGMMGQGPAGMEPPRDRDPGQRPEGLEPPDGTGVPAEGPDGGFPAGDRRPFGTEPPWDAAPDGMGRPGAKMGQDHRGTPPDFGGEEMPDGEGSTEFTLTQTVKSFSGVCDSAAAGKRRVSFTVAGPVRSGSETILPELTGVTASLEIDPSLVQITVTDDPSEDYAASCLLSEGLAAVNALLPTEEGSYRLTVAVVSGAEEFTGATQLTFRVGALPFVDVTETTSGYDAIRTLYQAGILQGTGPDTFSPDLTVTRAQAVTALARLAGAAPREGSAFSDVEPGAWYAAYVSWAEELGIVEGDGQGHFYPDQPVTARQMAQMLSRWQGGGEPASVSEDLLTRAQMAQMLADAM